MISAKDFFNLKPVEFNPKIPKTLDFDFSSVSRRIDTYDDFEKEILNVFYSGEGLFFRGERLNSSKRNLLPTLYRKPEALFSNDDIGIIQINSKFLYDYYSSLGSFVDVFSKTMGRVDENNLYDICAFAQHYYHSSPFIDFSKSLYPALSFALKDREQYDDDIVLYVLEINNKADYTNDINVANKWLKDINIYLSHFDEKEIKKAIKELRNNRKVIPPEEVLQFMEQINTPPVPKAKLIDVPTNTRMKFQQGVFLMLTDFHLFNVRYFTKNIREQFSITKYIINKDICPMINNLIKQEAPWYMYECLTDVEKAFNIATKE